MKIKFTVLLVVAALLAVLSPRAAHADLGYWSAALIGTWKHPRTGEIYRFNSDATYTLTYAQPTADAIVGSSGWWKIAQPTAKESGGSQEGPVALIIKTRKLTLQNGDGQKTARPFNRDRRAVVDTISNGESDNRNLYRIDGVNWERVQ